MDKLDWKILAILDWEGRLSVSQIAKRVRSNKDVVSYRIKKLENNGIIVRYFPVLDMFKLGYHTVRLYFDLEEINVDEEQEFVRFLDEDIQVGLIFRMDYPYRYGVVLWMQSVYDVQDVLVKIKKKLGKRLIRYQLTLFSTFRQYPKDYLFDKERHTLQSSLEPNAAVPYDEQDFMILQELARNARASTVAISKKTKIPQTTVSHKIRSLEKKGIIMGYRADINFIALGHMNYFLEIYLDENSCLQAIEFWANTHKNVVWLQKIIGACDIEIEVEVKDRVALEKLLNDLRNTFPSIRKIVFWSQEYKKLTFLPAKKN